MKKLHKHVQFKATKEEQQAINRIVDRALLMNPEADRLSLNMDITACHANGCPLDFEKLESFDAFNFAHDVFGISRHIDRNTGELTRCFLPHCAK